MLNGLVRLDSIRQFDLSVAVIKIKKKWGIKLNDSFQVKQVHRIAFKNADVFLKNRAIIVPEFCVKTNNVYEVTDKTGYFFFIVFIFPFSNEF